MIPSGWPLDFLAPVSITSVSGVTGGGVGRGKTDLPPEARLTRIGASGVEARVPRELHPWVACGLSISRHTDCPDPAPAHNQALV